ncbi:MAG TPA: hypothetical protein VHJ17_20485 [Thermomonospora sp.]|nr:hypothetical protein [Thermomonospora sp.]
MPEPSHRPASPTGPDTPSPTGRDARDTRDERARAAGTGEAEHTDIRVAGPPPAPVRQRGDTEPEPVVAPVEVATSFPAPPHPRAHPERFMDPGAVPGLRERWREVQAGFVDDPREAVRRADALAEEVLTALKEQLHQRKRELDAAHGDEGDTERLRRALRDYRDFFDRLLEL